jgi:TPR repeat protein
MNRCARLFGLALVLFCSSVAQLRAQFDQFGVDEQGLRRLAEEGEIDAQFQLGLRLAFGEGLKKNPAEGATWLEKAAKSGHAKAMNVLGSLYEQGVGVTEDPSKAAHWYQKAVDKEEPDAYFRLALLYQNGRGVKQDAVKATELAQEGANLGYAPAQTLYASKLASGDGVNKNSAKAALWFLKAAKQDNTYAQRQLAYLYYTGNGVPLDYPRCQAWYARAAQSTQDPWAMNDLAWFLSTCPDAKFHKPQEATEIAKAAVMALEVTEGEQRHEIIDTMAAALARNSQFAEALVWQRRSLKLLDEDKALTTEEKDKLRKEFTERMSLYKAQKPYADQPAKTTPDSEPLYNDTILQDGNGGERLDPRAPNTIPKPRKGGQKGNAA